MQVQNNFQDFAVYKSYNIKDASEAEFIFLADVHQDEKILNSNVNLIKQIIKNRLSDAPISLFLESLTSMKKVFYTNEPYCKILYESNSKDFQLSGWDIDYSIKKPLEEKYAEGVFNFVEEGKKLCEKIVVLQKSILGSESKALWAENLKEIANLKEMDFLSHERPFYARARISIENYLKIKDLILYCKDNSIELIEEVKEILDIGENLSRLKENAPTFINDIIRKTQRIRTESMNSTIEKVSEMQMKNEFLFPAIFVAGASHLVPSASFLGDPDFDLSSFFEEISRHKSVVLVNKEILKHPEFSHLKDSV